MYAKKSLACITQQGWILIPVSVLLIIMLWIILAATQQIHIYTHTQYQQAKQHQLKHHALLIIQAIGHDLALSGQLDYLTPTSSVSEAAAAHCTHSIEQVSRFNALGLKGCLSWQIVSTQSYQLDVYLQGSYSAWRAYWEQDGQGWQRLWIKPSEAPAEASLAHF